MPILSSDVVNAINEALDDNDEQLARRLLREHEECLSNRQRKEVRALFDSFKQR